MFSVVGVAILQVSTWVKPYRTAHFLRGLLYKTCKDAVRGETEITKQEGRTMRVDQGRWPRTPSGRTLCNGPGLHAPSCRFPTV